MAECAHTIWIEIGVTSSPEENLSKGGEEKSEHAKRKRGGLGEGNNKDYQLGKNKGSHVRDGEYKT